MSTPIQKSPRSLSRRHLTAGTRSKSSDTRVLFLGQKVIDELRILARLAYSPRRQKMQNGRARTEPLPRRD